MTATREDLSVYAPLITSLIKTGDVASARRAFERVLHHHPNGIDGLVMALGDATAPHPGTVTFGPAPLVFGNPTRTDWVGRCGHCFHAWRDGTGRPAVGVNYRTLRGARAWANQHATEHDRVEVEEVDW